MRHGIRREDRQAARNQSSKSLGLWSWQQVLFSD